MFGTQAIKKYKRSYFDSRFGALKQERERFISLWKDCRNMFLPAAGNFAGENALNDGAEQAKRYRNLLNSIGTFAVERLAAGMMSGLTSPIRQWFRLTTENRSLRDRKDVQVWLYEVENIIRAVFLKSNVYRTLTQVYMEAPVFGQFPFAVVADTDTVIHCIPFTCGEYVISSMRGKEVDTIYYESSMTVSELVAKFGLKNVSQTVKALYEKQCLSNKIDIVHAVEPNLAYDPRNNLDKPYISVYYEKANPKTFLSFNGFSYLPIIAPRWDIIPNTWYGNAPAYRCLSDALMLQRMQKDKIKLVELAANPPKVVPTSMQNVDIAYIPGATFYSDNPNDGIRALNETKVDLNALEALIQQTEQRLEKGFYNDLFLMIAQISRTMTATEVGERKEEKLLMLGSVVDRLQNELLRPLIHITFDIAYQQGLIPDPPEVLQGTDLKIEYISLLAQAQKIMQTGSISSFVQFVASLAQLSPDAVDKLNVDQSIDDFADYIGTPPSVVRSDEGVSAIRQARQEAQAQTAQQAQNQSMIDNAEKLSKISLTGDNALAALIGSS